MTPSGTRPPFHACALALLALGCETESPYSPGSGTASSVVLPAPRAALATRALEPDALSVAVTVAGRALDVTFGPDGERRARVTVPRGEALPLEITWFDASSAWPVALFALSSTLEPVSAGGEIVVEGSYVEVNADGGEETNYRTLALGGDPFAASRTIDVAELDPQAVRVDKMALRLGSREPAATPKVDGCYDAEDGIWSTGTFRSESREYMYIDNLLIDNDAEAADGRPKYRWHATHDGTFLYLGVQFEGARDFSDEGEIRAASEFTAFRDSESRFDDDGLNLFFDGDRSGRRASDGVDDLYLHIPMTPPGGGDGSVIATRPLAADPDAAVEEIEAASGVCGDQRRIWEVKVPLQLAGIEVGRPFGFEVQIDQDRDGGGRDARWGWANPSIANRPDDFRFESPAFNGVVVLLEERS